MTEDERTVSNTEMEVLKVLWEIGEGTVREIDAVLRKRRRRWAYTTVLTLLTRLQAKGYVESDKSGQAHVFRPSVSRDKLLRRRLGRLVDDVCEGTAAPLVHALIEGRRFSPDEIAGFRRLLDDLAPLPEDNAKKKRTKPPKA